MSKKENEITIFLSYLSYLSSERSKYPYNLIVHFNNTKIRNLDSFVHLLWPIADLSEGLVV